MIVLVSGGSGTGKSALAESIAQKLGGKMIYIATMPIRNEDDLVKIERHHKLRAGKGFTTIERQNRIEHIPEDTDTVLLECLSTHTSNIMFSYDEQNGDFFVRNSEECVDIIIKEIDELIKTVRNVVFVSAESNLEGCIYDEVTESFKKALTDINIYAASVSDTVIETVAGIPFFIKGNLDL